MSFSSTLLQVITLFILSTSIGSLNLSGNDQLFLDSKTNSISEKVKCDGRYKHHLQGVCSNTKHFFWSFTTTLVKTDKTGKLIKKIPVVNHHGDICFYKGKIYVAVNLGKFNDPKGNADSWIYVYRAADLKELARHEIQQVFHGAGGVGVRDGNFFVVGGLPDNVDENYVYEYDEAFNFKKKHTIKSGHTHLGIQTATFFENRWYFGCYGSPQILIVTDRDFKMIGRYKYNCSYGIEGFTDGQLYSAAGNCLSGKGCDGTITIVRPHKDLGLIPINKKIAK